MVLLSSSNDGGTAAGGRSSTLPRQRQLQPPAATLARRPCLSRHDACMCVCGAAQGDITAGRMIWGVEGVDPARREALVSLLDIDLYQRLNTMSDGQRRRVQIAMGLLKPYDVRQASRGRGGGQCHGRSRAQQQGAAAAFAGGACRLRLLQQRRRRQHTLHSLRARSPAAAARARARARPPRRTRCC